MARSWKDWLSQAVTVQLVQLERRCRQGRRSTSSKLMHRKRNLTPAITMLAAAAAPLSHPAAAPAAAVAAAPAGAAHLLPPLRLLRPGCRLATPFLPLLPLPHPLLPPLPLLPLLLPKVQQRLAAALARPEQVLQLPLCLCSAEPPRMPHWQPHACRRRPAARHMAAANEARPLNGAMGSCAWQRLPGARQGQIA